MRYRGRSGFGFALACLTAFAMVASTTSAPAAARNPRPRIVLAPAPDKDAALVIDGATGHILYARNVDEIRYPASLTKMMTLYLLFDALEQGKIQLDTLLIASPHVAEQEPTKLGLKIGDPVPVETAIKAMTVLSANDVAVLIAEALAQTENNFAFEMTEKAHELGMVNTNFHNASGLPDKQQLTTARDMAILGRHLAYDFPQYYHYFSTPSFVFQGRTYAQHDNLLLAFNGTDGIKTGYTRDSGFNLVSSVVRDNKHILGVVMGGRSAATRDHEMMRLLTAAFNYADENPTAIADADVPWLGGKGHMTETATNPTGDDNVLASVIDTQAKRPVQTADAKGSRRSPKYVAAGIASLPSLSLTSSDAADKGSAKSSSLATVKRWAVQIGVYADQAIAEAQLAEYAQRAIDVLGQAQKLIVPYTSGDGHTLYRARFGTFAENEARDICKKIAQRGDSCFAAEIN
ncbi:MAG TPA: D-alanyl-D-alanine carboxypeptidase [Micropepsaceae bacterium]|nr:D-alanyl-D-alanine carboxypeptidase [Micropepsaceae bacterium]